MKYLLISTATLIVCFLTGYFGMKFINDRYIKYNVLSQFTETNPATPLPTQTLTPAPTNVPTLSPTPKPTNTPSPTSISQPTISAQEIHSLMERFAGQYGVDVNVLRHIAVCESGFNPLAINNSYIGLFQFNKITWINNRKLMGEDINPDLRLNAEESIQTAAFLIANGKKYLWPNCYP